MEIGTSEAVLLLRLLLNRRAKSRKSRGVGYSRTRLNGITLRKLWKRETVTPQFVEQVSRELINHGWILFPAQTKNMFAAIKLDVVENWPVTPAAILREELDKIEEGKFSFRKLKAELHVAEEDGDDDED
jgi:hypothetical protein